ncbi:MAG: hypothetical protein HFI40_07750 [Lachnospiraceae bacterium]|jgi:putative membrane protein|nr:hypothetical protein [Lachnospiraceae bacterium]
MRKWQWKKSMAVVLSITMVLSLAGCGAEEAKTAEVGAVFEEKPVRISKAELNGAYTADYEKAETVYVLADANGSAEQVLVSSWLKNTSGAENLLDCAELENLMNVKGDERYCQEDGELIWQAKGADIYYQGESSQEAPVEVCITYYLDGEEIAPQDLAGKSGRLKMRFDYINHAKQEVMIGGKQESIYTPFGMVTGVLLPVDRVKNLEVTNGQVISDGSQQIAVGMAFPGLRESLGLTDTEENARDWGELQLADYVEMEADVTDFELAMTITAASPDLLKQLLEEGSKQEQEHDLDSVKDGVKELTDASARLAEGSQEVAEGSQELADGSRELAEGSKNLVSGSKELENGSKKLESGSREIKTGADTLVEKTGELATGAADLHSGIAAYTTGVSELADGIAALGDGTTALTTGSDTLDAGIGELKNGADALVAGYEGEHGAVAGAKTLAAGLEQLSQAMSGLPLPEEYAGVIKQVEQLAQGANGLSTGVEQLYQGTVSLQTGIQTLAGGAATLKAGIGQMEEGVKALSEGAGQLTGSSEALKSGAKSLADGGKLLQEGAITLAKGSLTLSNGAASLTEGATALSGGAAALSEGADALSVGAAALAEGTITLHEGMVEFDQEGIQALSDVLGDLDLADLKERLEAMLNAAKVYRSFAGNVEEAESHVSFLIRTDSIRKK